MFWFVAWTENRLQTLSEGADDYINASMLKALLPGSPDYIACQGPVIPRFLVEWELVSVGVAPSKQRADPIETYFPLQPDPSNYR